MDQCEIQLLGDNEQHYTAKQDDLLKYLENSLKSCLRTWGLIIYYLYIYIYIFQLHFNSLTVCTLEKKIISISGHCERLLVLFQTSVHFKHMETCVEYKLVI